MSLAKPIVRSPITPFPATQSKAFYFDVYGGAQVMYNEIQIQRNSDNFQVYLNKMQSFQYTQTVPASTLTNNVEYKVRFRTYDVNNVTPSSWSDWVVFWALVTPTVLITNIIDGKINNQTYIFEGSYTQTGDTLQSYRFLLYDHNQVLLKSFDEKFGEPIQQEVAGNENGKTYYLELITISTKGMAGTSGKVQFVPNYIQPILSTVLQLENVPEQAAIKITANVVQILFEVESGTYSYENDDWINLKNGSIFAQDGFSILNDFTLKLWAKDLPINYSFLVLTGTTGTIELQYDGSRIQLYKKPTNGVNYRIHSAEISPNISDTVGICIQQIGVFCNIIAEIVV